MVTHNDVSESPVVARHTRPVRAHSSRRVGASDEQLEQAVRARLARETSTARKSVAVRVSKGRATTAGVVQSRDELARVQAAVRSTPGIARICNLVVVDAERARRSRETADALRDSIAFECNAGDVSVAVFGGTAVMSGRVPSNDDRLALELVAHRDRGVTDVVNRTTVVASQPE